MFALSLPVAILGLTSAGLILPQPTVADMGMTSTAQVEASGATAISAGTEITRSPDGLFYVTAIVNGAPVRFVVDTGSTIVVLTPEDARRIGLGPGSDNFTAKALTANGRAAIARVRLDEVIVGTTRREAIDAAVVGKDLHVSLLGQSLLSRLNSVTIQANRMVLN